ncbi:hypothetical protein LSAT2_002567 [Lamellibrachia satsuma]|nr:hypothetical protein LSAT2_002567 [Lamellibrachia satsuma]
MGTDSASVSRVTADVLAEFLEVAFHAILYSRELYPASVFHTTKKYNVPVQMCCHQGVRQYIQSVLTSVSTAYVFMCSQMCCHQGVRQYIQSVLTSVSTVLEKGQLEQVVFVILDSCRTPLQRFVFELVLPNTRVRTSDDLCLLKLEQQLRGFILKINTSDGQLTAVPSESTWTVQVHTTQVIALEMQQQQCIQDFTWILADSCETCMEDRRLVPPESCQL